MRRSLVLQVNFVGTVDFDSGQFQFDATLYDSRILDFTLTGDMAVRFYWKRNANLLLTAGGFNPAYTPPPMNLGALARFSIVLFDGNPDVRAEAYFAVTSNTIQFGGRIELNYSFSEFSVQGFLSLDVLITPLTFHFIADIAGMMAVKIGSHTLFSISLALTLEGPLPWHAKGTGSFEIGFVFTITIRVHFDITVGEVAAALLAPIDVLAEIASAVADLGQLAAASARRIEPVGDAPRDAGSGRRPRPAPVRLPRRLAEAGAARDSDSAIRLDDPAARQRLRHRRRRDRRRTSRRSAQRARSSRRRSSSR